MFVCCCNISADKCILTYSGKGTLSPSYKDNLCSKQSVRADMLQQGYQANVVDSIIEPPWSLLEQCFILTKSKNCYI